MAWSLVPLHGAQPLPVEPGVEWSFLIREPSDCPPAIGKDGTLYFGSFSGKFWAVDKGGYSKWVFRASREIKSAAAIGPDDTIYFGCRDRSLYALGPEGRKKWQFTTGAWVDCSPAVGDTAVYFGSWDKSFYALNFDGSLKWKFQTGGPIVSSPAIGREGTIFFGSHDRKFYALAAEGRKSWSFDAGGAVISSPALGEDGTVYFTSVNGSLYALGREGELKWRLKTGGITASSPVIGQGGTLFVGVNENLWAIEPGGKKKWEQPFSEGIETAPLALSDDSVCFLSGSGVLINLEVPHKFHWHRALGRGTAGFTVGADGLIYAVGVVMNEGDFLYALKTSVPLAKSAWPKFRGNAQNTGRSISQP